MLKMRIFDESDGTHIHPNFIDKIENPDYIFKIFGILYVKMYIHVRCAYKKKTIIIHSC